MRMRRRIALAGSLVLILSAVTRLQAQEPVVARSRSEFANADRASKLKTLQAIGKRQGDISAVESVGILGVALDDRDAEIRRLSCEVVILKAATSRNQTTAGQQGADDGAALLPLRGQLARLITTDDEPRVRHAAILAQGNLEYAGSQTKGIGIKIGREFAETLAGAYGNESVTFVRAEIVKSLALTDADTPKRQEILEKALSDPAPEVVQFALAGVGRSGFASSLPRIVVLLKHSEARVRMASAQALAKFGAAAKSYLPQLRDALAVEQDDVTRKTLQGAIEVVEKSK